MNNRLHSLDALRATMMLLGIVLHGAASFVVYPISELWAYKFPETHLFFDVTLTVIHLFRIPVFYIIAGFFMEMQLQKYALNIVVKKKIRRILIPFLFGLFCLAPIVTFAFYLLQMELSISWQAFQDYWELKIWNTVHFWFLYYLIFYYVVHIFYWKWLRFFFQKIKISMATFIAMVFFFQIIILIIFGNKSIHGNYLLLPELGSVLYFMNYYFIGIFMNRHRSQFMKLTQFSIRNIILATILTTAYLIFRKNEDAYLHETYWQVSESFLSVATAFSLVVSTFSVFDYLFFGQKNWIDLLAKSSYTIYMVHLPILVWLIYFLKNEITNPFLFYGALVGVAGVIAFGVYWLKEKVRKWF